MPLRNKYEKRLISYKALLNTISESAVYTDISFIIQSWNKAAENIYALTEEQAIGQYLFTLTDFSIVNGSVEQVLESIHITGFWTGEALIEHANGKELNIYISINPINNENGDLIGYATVSKDITETVKAKGSITTLQTLFNAFMNHSPALSWIIDDEGICHYFNDLYLKTFHLSAEDIGKHTNQLFPKEIAEEFLENNAIVFNTSRPLEFIEKAVEPDGKIGKYKVLKFPLDLQGTKKYMGGVAINITSELEKQEQLSLSNERFRLVNKATDDHIWDWDIETDKITIDNFDSDETEERSWHTLEESLSKVNNKDRERISKSLSKSINDPFTQYWEDEYSTLSNDGSYRTVVDKGYIIRNADGKATRMIGAQHDITELKALQHKLVKQERSKQKEMVKAVMDAQERERLEIAYELHENVNQLLTTCKLQMQSADLYANDKMYFSRISSLLQNIIDEIRSISHQLNPANIETIGLIPTIEDIVSKINAAGKLKLDFHFKKIAITDRFNKEIELVIFRIVQEQLQNIIKHASATHADISLQRNKAMLCLHIKDNGKGFDLSNTQKGLGLTNIISRAAYCGGNVAIKTSLGKGCKISVNLPIRPSTKLD